MKNKKSVYFPGLQDSPLSNHNSDSSKKPKSFKNIRQTSSSIIRKKAISSASRRYPQNKSLTGQKLKVIVSEDSFLIKKKMLNCEIQCIFKQKSQKNSIENSTELSQDAEGGKNVSYKGKEVLNIQGNSFSIWKAMVKHIFPIEQDQNSYLKISIPNHEPVDVKVPNRRVELCQEDKQTRISEIQYTEISPLSLLEQRQQIREWRISNFWLHNKKLIRKELLFCQQIEKETGQDKQIIEGRNCKAKKQHKSERNIYNRRKGKQVKKAFDDLTTFASMDLNLNSINIQKKDEGPCSDPNKRKESAKVDPGYGDCEGLADKPEIQAYFGLEYKKKPLRLLNGQSMAKKSPSQQIWSQSGQMYQEGGLSNGGQQGSCGRTGPIGQGLAGFRSRGYVQGEWSKKQSHF